MFTRRCSERRFFLRPDSETVNAYWYCLGWAAQKHGQELHAACALSNHHHVSATDRTGAYPDFLRDLHGMLARVMNALRGRWEYFWDASQTSAVMLEDEEAQLDKLVYVLANPVSLVGDAHRWPGATALHAIETGEPIVARRPEHFFRDDEHGGEMPETVELVFTPPPALAHLPRGEYVQLILQRLADIEASAAADHQTKGTRPLGRGRVLRQAWGARPLASEPRRRLSPRVACRNKWLRVERLRQNKTFQRLYKEALRAFRAGLVAIFPHGTWLMRFRASIQVGTA